MGRIRGRSVRYSTVEVLKRYKDKFTDDFENNKLVLRSVIDADKRSINKIAGYITRLSREKKIEAFVIEFSG